MGGMFFTGWALWEEMTFVLGLAIVFVFFLGLVKLWWTNRSVKKQEIIDEEKRARLTEMAKTGLSPRSPTKKGEIPFGVRALQRGIEVDGIWISRPGTPSRNSSKSKADGLTILEIDADGKTRTRYVPDNSRPNSGISGGRPVPYRNYSGASPKESCNGSETTDTRSMRSMTLPQISEDSTVPNRYRAGRLNEEALRRLEGQTAMRGAHLNTYIPSSRLSSPNSSISRGQYRPGNGKRHSTSSAESLSSSGGSRNQSSSSSHQSFQGRQANNDKSGYTTLSQATPEKAGRVHEPERSSTGTTNTVATASSADSNVPLMTSQSPIAMPQLAFGPGDTYANRMARRVNAGFEVLPAGTFAPPHDLSRSSSGGSRADEAEEVDRISRQKPRKKTTQPLGQEL